jgi:hypothetical protein
LSGDYGDAGYQLMVVVIWRIVTMEDDKDDDDFHRLINLVCPHKRLLRSDRVALGLHPGFKYVVIIMVGTLEMI